MLVIDISDDDSCVVKTSKTSVEAEYLISIDPGQNNIGICCFELTSQNLVYLELYGKMS